MSQSQLRKRSRISLSSRAGDRRSPFAWIGSLALHGGLIGATLFTFAHTLDISDESAPMIPVDLVTIADKTNIAPRAKPAPVIKPDEITPQPHEIQVQTPVIPQQDTQETPDRTQADNSAEVAPAPTPAAKPLPQATPAKPKPKADQFAALLNKLTSPAATTSNTKPADRSVKGIGQMNAMTMDLVDALRDQISQCWNAPVGASHPEQLIVTVEVFLNSDGSVAQPPQLTADSAAAASGNPFLRAAGDAAMRAIYVCAPYKLPADRYQLWRDITVTFDPRKMAGAE